MQSEKVKESTEVGEEKLEEKPVAEGPASSKGEISGLNNRVMAQESINRTKKETSLSMVGVTLIVIGLLLILYRLLIGELLPVKF